MAATHAEHLQANWEKLFEHAEDWRRRALASLTLGNGAGLVAYGTLVSNAANPDVALKSVLVPLWLFSVGVIAAATLPFIAYRHDAGLSALGRGVSEVVNKLKSDLPAGHRDASIESAMSAFSGMTSKFGSRHVWLTRVIIFTSATCFVVGLSSPLIAATVGGHPLRNLAKEASSSTLKKASDEMAAHATSERKWREGLGKALLDGRCEEGRRLALLRGDLDAAEQVLRVCVKPAEASPRSEPELEDPAVQE